MAKAGLREQSRLSGANRNALIAEGIMANTAEIFNFPVPDVAQKERRVADPMMVIRALQMSCWKL